MTDSDRTLRASTAAALIPVEALAGLWSVAHEGGPAVLRLVQQAEYYMAQATAESTRAAYAADWADFTGWCRELGVEPHPANPEVVACYLADRAHGRSDASGVPTVTPLRHATLSGRLVGLRAYYRATGDHLDTRHPLLHGTWQGIRRVLGTFSAGKDPITIDELRALVTVCPRDTLRGLRDRALLLVGFAGALRRSELVAVAVEHIRLARGGLTIRIPRSKRDQEGRGALVRLGYGEHTDTCPVRALDAWLAAAHITTGPAFRKVTKDGTVVLRRGRRVDALGPARAELGLNDASVARIIKRLVRAARAAATASGDEPLAALLDPVRYAGHSLRSGFITTAYARRVPEEQIQEHARQVDPRTTRRYNKRHAMVTDCAATKMGL